jgi:hypothetical protein
VAALDDQQDLAIAEAVHLLVGATNVRQHGKLVPAIVEHDRVVGGDQSAVVSADQRRPWVLPNQAPHDICVRDRVFGIVSHQVVPAHYLEREQ